MIKRRHATVVEVRIVRPDAGQGGSGLSFALLECAFSHKRACIEHIDEAVRDDVTTSAIRSDVRVDTRPPYVSLSIVFTVASRASQFLRIKEGFSFFRKRRINFVRIGG